MQYKYLRNFFMLSLLIAVAIQNMAAQSNISAAQAAAMRERLIVIAEKYLGAPYKYGGRTPDGFDCSGFVSYVADEALDIKLPRTSTSLYSYTRIIPDAKREVGDLVFFKTTSSGNISHVGIYIGDAQFIHSASDGPKTGIIISSLSENYWKRNYSGTGQFLPSGNLSAVASVGVTEQTAKINAASASETATTTSGGAGAKNSTETTVANNSESASSIDKNSSQKSGKASSYSFFELDSILTVDWSFFNSEKYKADFRGVTLFEYFSYNRWKVVPGFGLMFRYNAGVGAFQMPLVVGVSFTKYTRIYTGFAFSFGSAKIPGNGESIRAPIVPGIFGIMFRTPALKLGIVEFRLVQDLNLTVYEKKRGSIKPGESLAAGFEFSTGISVNFPLPKRRL